MLTADNHGLAVWNVYVVINDASNRRRSDCQKLNFQSGRIVRYESIYVKQVRISKVSFTIGN